MRDRYNRRTVERGALTDTALAILPLADVKAFLRIDTADDDALLTMLIGAAVEAAEVYTRRAIRRAAYTSTMDGFPGDDDEALVRLGSGVITASRPYVLGSSAEFDLPYPPVNSVTTIETYTPDNTFAVFAGASYLLDNSRIVLNQGYTWPTGLRDRAAVKVTYAAGYGPSNLPMPIKLGMMQHIVAMYECRTGCDMPDAARGLMSGYRVLDGMTW